MQIEQGHAAFHPYSDIPLSALLKDVSLNPAKVKECAPNTDKIQSVRIVPLIETVITIGKGTEDDPMRYLYQYWDYNGNMVAQNEPKH